MPWTTRRQFLVGAASVGSVVTIPVMQEARGAGAGAAAPRWPLEKIGHSLLGAPGEEFAEGSVRDDGRYAAIGTWNGDRYGSFLVDLEDPTTPRRAHFLPSPDRVMNLDVKFDARDGLYYRSQQPIEDQGMSGVEAVDYGYDAGTPTDPAIIGRLDAGSTHNVCTHPTEPIVYAVNHDSSPDTRGLEVWDVRDPAAPERRGEYGLKWSLHDVTIDTRTGNLHCAYGEAYVVMDASDPFEPTELGRIEYADRPNYAEVGLGNEGWETGHFAKQDPRRDIVVMGDEVSTGVPGGKHVIDIGWGEGSPEDPVPIGFTVSPNAKVQEPAKHQDKGDIVFDWTGHNFDIVPWGDATLLVSGDWHEGVVLYDITDPRDPTPITRYQTDDGVGRLPNQSRWGKPPMTWSAVYNAERDFVVASDTITGVYTLDIGGDPKSTPAATPTTTPGSSTGDMRPRPGDPRGARTPPPDSVSGTCSGWRIFDLDCYDWTLFEWIPWT